LSEFIVQSAQEAANRIIEEQGLVQLGRAEPIAFAQGLLNPPRPNLRLRKAVKQYRAELDVWPLRMSSFRIELQNKLHQRDEFASPVASPLRKHGFAAEIE
jgi:hypothetical protein